MPLYDNVLEYSVTLITEANSRHFTYAICNTCTWPLLSVSSSTCL